jgi:hypothetical protein
MTQDDPLLDLRDIHLPPAPSGPSGQTLAPEPFIVLAAMVVIMVVYGRWRQGRWRREARIRLRRIETSLSSLHGATGAEADRWLELVELATEVARRTKAAALPDCVFMPPTQTGHPERKAGLNYLHRTLGAGR